MKTNMDSIYKNDKALESGGIWFRVSPTTRFLVKRFGGANSEPVKRALAMYHKPYARQLSQDLLSPEEVALITAKTFVHSCLIGWEGVVIDDKETQFDKETAIKLLVNMPEMLEDLFSYAQDGANYREELGNS